MITQRSTMRPPPRNHRAAALRNMWAKDPHCHWCGGLTILSNGRPPKATHATRDHLKTRNMGRAKGERCVIVLACYSCNSGRNDLEQKTLAGKRVSRDMVKRFEGKDGAFPLAANEVNPLLPNRAAI